MARRLPFISRVRLRNYKSIAECDVNLGPLTILIGPNASGKSNFLDALAFLARAIRTTPNQAIEERGGLDAILRNVPNQAESFEINVETNFPWDGDLLLDERPEQWARGSYGFRLMRDPANRRPFVVHSETCSLETPSHQFDFTVSQGYAREISRDGPLLEENIEPDSLFLQVAGTRRTYSPLSRRLRSMSFYNFANEVLREPEPVSREVTLGSRGERLASVLGGMEEISPVHKQRLDEYLRAIVPGTIALDQWIAGPFMTVKLRMAGTDDGKDVEFGPPGMSDGTIRAAGVLAALFQPSVTQGHTSLVGIEEPEIALHPAAAGVLFDALSEASHQVQVMATSQSPDLLDRDDLDVGIVRAVSMTQGLTTIGEIDEPSRRIIKDKLYTLGELMRGNQNRARRSIWWQYHSLRGVDVTPVTIACVVEGHGEVTGLPKVLYRIAHQFSIWDLLVPKPYRLSRGSLIKTGGIERAVDAEASRVGGPGGVLIVLDADDDCPAQLGPSLLARAQAARPDKLVSVVLPKIEFEAWFIAAAVSLGGICGLPDGLEIPINPEVIRDAKGWLSARRTDGLQYSSAIDQATLASAFDLEQARKTAPSFDKFCRDVESRAGVKVAISGLGAASRSGLVSG